MTLLIKNPANTCLVSAGITVLEKLAKESDAWDIEFEHFPWGSDFYKKHGHYLPSDALTLLKQKDAILFGAVGAPDVPDHLSLWGLRLAICQPLQQFANVRPTRILRGTQSPLRNCKEGDLDWVIVREKYGRLLAQFERSRRLASWRMRTNCAD